MSRLPQTLQPEVLRWARRRASLTPVELARKLGVKAETVSAWESSGQISRSQVNRLARRTHTPLGFLYLKEPRDEALPIPDFRTPRNRPVRQPSPNLLETVYAMQRRQAWAREEMIENGDAPLNFIREISLKKASPQQKVVDLMRATLGLPPHWAARKNNWSEAIRSLRSSVEEAGILLFFNGIVGNNTHRKLSPQEFQGFALVDEYAPLIFINGADFKAAQMFTLAHELAHIFIAREGVSHLEAMQPVDNRIEHRCNQIAAEFLLPRKELQGFWHSAERQEEPYQAIAKQFKVSVLVAARRALDLNLIDRRSFFEFYEKYRVEEAYQSRHEKSGGDFWNNQNVRLGRRFGQMVVHAAQEGRLLHRDAYDLTGLKSKSFDTLANLAGG